MCSYISYGLFVEFFVNRVVDSKHDQVAPFHNYLDSRSSMSLCSHLPIFGAGRCSGSSKLCTLDVRFGGAKPAFSGG